MVSSSVHDRSRIIINMMIMVPNGIGKGEIGILRTEVQRPFKRSGLLII